jgi:2',3'-cyclic-nucleotide 2'-phosphodiesterase (5'-nucleotidase family)
MYKKSLLFLIVPAVIGVSSCRQHYELTDISRSRILVDSCYDVSPDKEAQAFLDPYQHKVDSIMSPVVGETAEYLYAHKPESPLSNLLADILVWGGKGFDEKVDFALYNVGGIRAAFAKGKVTYGDVVDVAPFENKICFLSLTGSKVRELFSEVAKSHGEGLSHGVNLVITKDGQLLEAYVNGKTIDDNAVYRVATLDYLAQGNDGLDAFKYGTAVVSPKSNDNNVRFIIMNYFRAKMSQGVAVDSKVEGRIVVK